MAQRNGIDYDMMFVRLKKHYDGYHFSTSMVDMYNPFSLVNAFYSSGVTDYWFDRGTSGALIDMLAQMPPVEVADLEGMRLPSTAFDLPFESFDNPLPILYQSGYLTIKDCKTYDFDVVYTLGFPNAEVRKGFAECLFRHVTARQMDTRQSSSLQLAYYDFRESDDLPAFIEAIKTFFASVPYQWAQDNQNEHHYHALLYTLLVAFGADVRAEEPTAKGRSDITLKMPRGIYVMELKYDKPIQEALDQINRKGYAEKYRLDGRPITKVGIAFSSEERNITDWQAEPL